MQWFNRKAVVVAVFLAGLLSLGVRPVGAHQITSATVTPNCTGFTITVAGTNLLNPSSGTVQFEIDTSPNVGTFTGSIAVSANDTAGDFSASQTVGWGPFNTTFSLSGTANLVVNGVVESSATIGFSPSSVSCSSTPPPCVSPSSNASNFNGTPMQGGNFIWFNANFTAKGIPSSGAIINFTNSTIQLGDTGQTLAVPNAEITFSSSASCASTTFDSITNTWMTTVPIAGSDEIFLDGLAFPLPAGFSGTIGGSVVWQGSFSSNVPGITVQWKWGAAVYTHFTTDYNALQVKASHQNACGVNNSDHAGTPEGTDTSTGESFKGFVIGGARGGGGSNFTGSWSGTQAVSVCT
jgi:hypothetical protein